MKNTELGCPHHVWMQAYCVSVAATSTASAAALHITPARSTRRLLAMLALCCCRDAPEGAVPGASRWESAEFHIKWKRHSYTHCTWECLATLRQLAGFKRVTNYCK